MRCLCLNTIMNVTMSVYAGLSVSGCARVGFASVCVYASLWVGVCEGLCLCLMYVSLSVSKHVYESVSVHWSENVWLVHVFVCLFAVRVWLHLWLHLCMCILQCLLQWLNLSLCAMPKLTWCTEVNTLMWSKFLGKTYCPLGLQTRSVSLTNFMNSSSLLAWWPGIKAWQWHFSQQSQ